MAVGILATWQQQPDEKKDWNFTYADWLAAKGDTIQSVSVVAALVSGGGTSSLTISNITNALGVVNFFATGGTTGQKYKVTCQVTTVGGRKEDGEAYIVIKDT